MSLKINKLFLKFKNPPNLTCKARQKNWVGFLFFLKITQELGGSGNCFEQAKHDDISVATKGLVRIWMDGLQVGMFEKSFLSSFY